MQSFGRFSGFIRFSFSALVVFTIGCGTDTAPPTPPAACPEPEPVVAVVPSAAPTVTLTKTTQASPAVSPGTPVAPAVPTVRTSVASGDLEVRRLVLATGVDKREPVGASSSFRVGEAERIYAFVEVGNRGDEKSEVLVSFERQDDDMKPGTIRLGVGASPRWRTWAYTRKLTRPGKYKAVVRDASGQVLAEAPFEMVLGVS